MKGLIEKYRSHFTHRGFLASLSIAVLVFCMSLVVNSYATSYATAKASNPVSDIVLDNIPVFDVDTIFFFGPLILIGFVTLIGFAEPRRIPFILKSVAVFIVVRSLFTILTHIAPSPEAMAPGTYLATHAGGYLEKVMFGGDLFFSGHTGLPFLFALIFWEKKWLRIAFIALSVFFGAIVLMAHIHYTIDVVAAFFITDGVFRLTELFFKKDRAVFKFGIEEHNAL